MTQSLSNANLFREELHHFYFPVRVPETSSISTVPDVVGTFLDELNCQITEYS